MAVPVVLPRQGQSVENCIITTWKKQVGDPVAVGDVLCEVETDKALVEIESPAAGTLLIQFFPEGAEVPVLTNIAAIGEPGEDISAFVPTNVVSLTARFDPEAAAAIERGESGAQPEAGDLDKIKISPRARRLLEERAVQLESLLGSGPGGRIIERDVRAALEQIAAQLPPAPSLTPVARKMVASGDYVAPAQGTGHGGRITTRDLQPAPQSAPPPSPQDDVIVVPLKGVRRIISQRMLVSMQTTAQLTLNSSADARALVAYRQRLKESDPALGLGKITINDLVLYATARTLIEFPDLNAIFDDAAETIYQHKRVHLGFAVDTPRGLIVPVIRDAHTRSLRALSEESARLAAAAQAGKATPDELSGGTFTVTNLGSFGIESFTPILNPPQVGILGVGNISLKPVEIDGAVQFVPHLGLSLTINHQVVDGAPAARFMQALARRIAAIDLLLAG